MMLQSALWYRRKNLSLIPIQTDGSKKPLIAWEQWQKELPSEEQVREWWTKWPNANIGIITGKINGISVIDIDWYKLSEEGKAELAKKLPAVFTPTSHSPRGGEHRYFKYTPALNSRAGIIEAVDTKSDGGYIIAPPSVNGNGKYEWDERAHIKDTPLHEVPEQYNSLFLDLYRAQARARVANAVPSTLNFNEGNRDETLFHIANVLVKGGMPELEIEQLLSLIASQCIPPFPQKELQEKVKSALKRVERREVNTMQEVRDFIAVTSGNFRVTEVEQIVTRVTTSSNKAILMALSRLCKEGIIERMPQPATYRVVEKLESVNIQNVTEMTPQTIWLPFNLERYVTIYPGNLIIIAGVTNTGKSALILNMILNNMGRWKCWYFSTEMSAQTVRSRIRKSRETGEWDFEIVENWNQSPDGIRPNDLNFCDWIEAGEEPWKVTAKLDRIQKKLRRGIAVVAMQKNPGVEHAIGGYQTQSKAALYITVDRKDRYDITKGQWMKVTKAKSFEEINPNDFVCEFKIVQGIELFPIKGWGPEEEPEDRYSQFTVTKGNKGNKR